MNRRSTVTVIVRLILPNIIWSESSDDHQIDLTGVQDTSKSPIYIVVVGPTQISNALSMRPFLLYSHATTPGLNDHSLPLIDHLRSSLRGLFHPQF